MNKCLRCGSGDTPIRDVLGYSQDQVNDTRGPERSLAKDKDGWAIYYCLPCARAWLFPLIDERCGNTYKQMRTDFAKDDAAQIALNVPSNRLVTGGYGKPVKRPKDIGDLAAEAEKIAERDN